MSKKSKKKKTDGNHPYDLGDVHDYLYDKYTVISATECTGLIPFSPDSEQERDNYKQIYDTP